MQWHAYMGYSMSLKGREFLLNDLFDFVQFTCWPRGDYQEIPTFTSPYFVDMASSLSSDDPQLRQVYRDFISGCHILHYHR